MSRGKSVLMGVVALAAAWPAAVLAGGPAKEPPKEPIVVTMDRAKVMRIPAPADNGYGIPEGLVFGLPCECKNGTFTLIKGLEIDEYSKGKIAITLKELEAERAKVRRLRDALRIAQCYIEKDADDAQEREDAAIIAAAIAKAT